MMVKISKLRNVVLISVMLIFAAVVVLEGVVVGQQQSNVEQPVLEISKTMVSGETTVPIRTKQYWDLEIVVTYDDQTDLNGVVVSDAIPRGITVDDVTISEGTVVLATELGQTKLKWDIGTMSPGDTETLTMSISTKTINLGRRRGWTLQQFIRPGEYELNEGASVSGIYSTGTITAGPTDPIVVTAEGECYNCSMGMGMRGGMWR